MRSKMPKLATLTDDAQPYVLAQMTVPKEHGTTHQVTQHGSLKRLDGEIKRTLVVRLAAQMISWIIC